jgi:hypothetical protein
MGFGMYSPGSFSSEKDLVLQANMSLWDRNAKTLAAYGFLRVVDKSNFAVSKENWLNATENFAQEILQGTPFKKL